MDSKRERFVEPDCKACLIDVLSGTIASGIMSLISSSLLSIFEQD